jgi:hypothetical protein
MKAGQRVWVYITGKQVSNVQLWASKSDSIIMKTGTAVALNQTAGLAQLQRRHGWAGACDIDAVQHQRHGAAAAATADQVRHSGWSLSVL